MNDHMKAMELQKARWIQQKMMRNEEFCRIDAGDDGQWITTENGHHVHLNGAGEPDKGNPHVISAMKSGAKTSGSNTAMPAVLSKKDISEIKEMVAGRGTYAEETVHGNTNPNKMAPEDNYTVRRHVVTLQPKASRNKEITDKLERLGFQTSDGKKWKKEISDTRENNSAGGTNFEKPSTAEKNSPSSQPKTVSYYKEKYGANWRKAMYNDL